MQVMIIFHNKLWHVHLQVNMIQWSHPKVFYPTLLKVIYHLSSPHLQASAAFGLCIHKYPLSQSLVQGVEKKAQCLHMY